MPLKSIQITKIYKSNTIIRGEIGKKHKKLKKSNVVDIFVGVVKFCSP